MLVLIAVSFVLPATAETAGTRVIECYCTDSGGERVELGEVICLTVGGRSFTAQCQMSLNSPMWRELHEGCLSSGLGPELPQPPFHTRLVHAHVRLAEAQPGE